jgi:hypothetical protein
LTPAIRVVVAGHAVIRFRRRFKGSVILVNVGNATSLPTH